MLFSATVRFCFNYPHGNKTQKWTTTKTWINKIFIIYFDSYTMYGAFFLTWTTHICRLTLTIISVLNIIIGNLALLKPIEIKIMYKIFGVFYVLTAVFVWVFFINFFNNKNRYIFSHSNLEYYSVNSNAITMDFLCIINVKWTVILVF